MEDVRQIAQGRATTDRLDVVVRVSGLCKSLPRRRSVEEMIRHPFRWQWQPVLTNIALEVRYGEILGIVGPNGAGKTTLLRVLCGLLLPDSGSAQVCGVDVLQGDHEIRCKVGYVPADENSLLGRVSGFENLEFFARLNGLSGKELPRRVMRCLEQVGLDREAGKRFANYSSGMKQRLLIARALLSTPELLVLDEPTRSLDPVSASAVRALINDLRCSHRCGVVVASHNLSEVETICDRVAVLRCGRVVVDGTIDQVVGLCQGSDQDPYRITVRGCPSRFREAAGALGLSDLESSEVGDNRIRLEVMPDSGRPIGQLIADLSAAGFDIESLVRGVSTLEDAFLYITHDHPDPQ